MIGGEHHRKPASLASMAHKLLHLGLEQLIKRLRQNAVPILTV